MKDKTTGKQSRMRAVARTRWFPFVIAATITLGLAFWLRPYIVNCMQRTVAIETPIIPARLELSHEALPAEGRARLQARIDECHAAMTETADSVSSRRRTQIAGEKLRDMVGVVFALAVSIMALVRARPSVDSAEKTENIDAFRSAALAALAVVGGVLAFSSGIDEQDLVRIRESLNEQSETLVEVTHDVATLSTCTTMVTNTPPLMGYIPNGLTQQQRADLEERRRVFQRRCQGFAVAPSSTPPSPELAGAGAEDRVRAWDLLGVEFRLDDLGVRLQRSCTTRVGMGG